MCPGQSVVANRRNETSHSPQKARGCQKAGNMLRPVSSLNYSGGWCDRAIRETGPDHLWASELDGPGGTRKPVPHRGSPELPPGAEGQMGQNAQGASCHLAMPRRAPVCPHNKASCTGGLGDWGGGALRIRCQDPSLSKGASGPAEALRTGLEAPLGTRAGQGGAPGGACVYVWPEDGPVEGDHRRTLWPPVPETATHELPIQSQD